MTISGAQFREATRLVHEMLREAADSWVQRHLLVWRVSR